jgi:hypothetical protein
MWGGGRPLAWLFVVVALVREASLATGKVVGSVTTGAADVLG